MGNTLYKNLAKHLKEVSLDKQKILDHFEITNINQWLDGNSKQPEGIERRELSNKLALLYLAFDIHPSKIVETYSLDFLEDNRIVTENSPEVLKQLSENYDIPKLLAYVILDGMRSQNDAKAFVNAVLPYIEKTNEPISVYEYLSFGNRNVQKPESEFYTKAHREIYNAYEAKIKTGKYTRIFALPFPDEKNIDLKDENTLIEYTGKKISYCSFETFRHICKCFATSKEKNSVGEFELFIAPWPTRLHHVALMGQIIIQEYPKYEMNGVFAPDLLFINDASRSDLYRLVYAEEFKQLTSKKSKRSFKVDDVLWDKGLQYAINKYSERVSDKDNNLISNKRHLSDLIKKDKCLKEKLGKVI